MHNDIHLDIKSVTMAHEFTICKNQKCDYSDGRRVCGICYVLSGEMLYKINSGISYVFGEGDVFFLPPNIAYTAVSKKDFKHFTVNFIADVNEECGFSAFEIAYIRNVGAGRFKTLFHELCDLYKNKGAGYSMKAVGYVYALMGEFISLLCERKMTSEVSKKMLAAKEYIDKNYKEPINVEDLAHQFLMSETNFRREFKRQFSEAPMHYRDRVRLSYAKEFLSAGFYNVGEVARLLGMEDEGYFCRFFKKHTGLTPKEYARRSGN